MNDVLNSFDTSSSLLLDIWRVTFFDVSEECVERIEIEILNMQKKINQFHKMAISKAKT